MKQSNWRIADWGKMAEGGEVDTPKKKWSLIEWAKEAASKLQPSVVEKEQAPNKITWGNLEQVLSDKPEMVSAGQSSNVDSVGYNEKEKKLEVKFKSGATYQYDNASKEDFDRMKKSHPGKYVHSNLKSKPFGRVE